MNCLENGQFTNSRLISIHEFVLILAVLVKTLHGVELGYVEVASDLTEVAVLMSEHAAAPVVALLFFIEGAAIFCSKFFFGICLSLECRQFFFTVSELTFLPVAAATVLDPILAKFSLIFLCCRLCFALRALASACGLLRRAADV